MDKHFNTDEAVAAQRKYCHEKGIPNFAPGLDGKCYRCNKDIYRQIDQGNGRTTGISVSRQHLRLSPVVLIAIIHLLIKEKEKLK